MNPYEAKQEARRERLEAAAARHAAEATAKIDAGFGFFRDLQGQPIHGVRDRNRRDKVGASIGRGFAQLKHAQELAGKAAAIGTGGISQDDADAVAKLRAELEKREAVHARMVAANKIVRGKGDDEAKIAQLDALGIRGQTARELLHPTSDYARRMGFRGFESWELSNNSANIRRIKGRIADLERMAATAPRESVESDRYRIEDDAEENRLILTLAERVDRDTFAWIRSQGWRWSRTRSAFLAYRTFANRLPWFLEQLNARMTQENPR